MTKIPKSPRLKFGKVLLRYPQLADFSEFTGNAIKSVAFHRDLVDPPREAGSFVKYLGLNDSETNCCFLVIEKESNGIAGAVNISQIFLKGFCSAYLGYYLFDGYSGRGIMTDAIKAVVKFAFDDLGLHRLEANIQPENESSVRLVSRCGFTKEGFSRKYLKIGSEWRDHERWAILFEDWNSFDGGRPE